jgi:transcriptional antiterminator RfaH
MTTAQWYVVQTRPHDESKAQEHLHRQGFTTYFPKLIKSCRRPRKTERAVRQLFPRYVFLRIDSSRGWHSIRSTFGVSQLVAGEYGPVPIRDCVIELLCQREKMDGYFRPNEMNLARAAAVA